MPFLRVFLAAALLAFGVGTPSLAQTSAPPTIAAAADLKFALDAVAAKYKADTGRDVTLVYGSSGNLTRQILADAPFDMFLSADEDYVAQLAAAGKTLDAGVLYAQGFLAVFVPKGASLTADAGLVDFKAALADGRLKRLAIANPDHAPYGRAARAALQSQGLWAAAEPKLVLGDNIAQAAQFAVTGSVDAAIIAYSLTFTPQVAGAGTFARLPGEWHAPLLQRMALMKGAGDAAKAFYAYVRSPPARAILRDCGFALPGETG